MKSVEQCKRSLKAFKGHLTRAIYNCSTVVASDVVDIDKLETSIAFLESKWPGYEQAYLELEAATIKDGSELGNVEDDYYSVWDNYQQQLVNFKVHLRSLKDKPTAQATHKPLQAKDGILDKPKLPEIKLPIFAGDYTEFDSFFDQFQAQIGKRGDLDPVMKLQYLKSQLRGSPLELIKDLPSISDNYKHAIDSLQEMYGDEDKIKRGILTKILDLEPPAHNKRELESFKISLMNLTRALADKQNYSDCDWIIAFMFQRKLTKATIHQLYLKYGKNYFSIEEMKEGLGNLVSHMELEGQTNKRKVNTNTSTNEMTNSDIGIYSTSKEWESKKPHSKTTKGFQSKPNCIFCASSHYTNECDKYSTLAARQSRLQQLQRCTRCISNHHTTADCRLLLLNCRKCGKGKHHTALCVSKNKLKSNFQEQQPAMQTSQQSVMSVKSNVTSKSTALPTATLEVCNERNRKKMYTRAFFDQGSQCTFIKEDLVAKLQLKNSGTIRLAMSGFLQSKDYEEYSVVRPVVRLGNRRKRIKAVVVNKLPDNIKVPGLMEVKQRLEERRVKLADKHVTSDIIDGIDLVIGGDFYGDFITGFATCGEIKLNKSSGGHLIFGQIPNYTNQESSSHHNAVVARLCVQEAPDDLSHLAKENEIPVHKLWDLDTIGINVSKPTPEDTLAYQSYLDSVQYKDDKYYVRLPWKINSPVIPSNYSMALGQLRSLTATLQSRNEVQMYHDIIQYQLDNNFIEVVPGASPKDDSHYLPHHSVKRDSITTPVRIVFNCSAKRGNNPSLNDCLMKGPSLTEKLGDVLLNFRTNAYAFSADISKAFLRIGLQECDRDYTRFLWYEDPQKLYQPVTYRFKSVLFGATSSPFLLQATLDYHLRNSDNVYKTIIAQNFYVDNFQGTVTSQPELFNIYENANAELTKANMPLQKWVSNNPALNQRIEEDFPEYDVPASTNILGLLWNARGDTISMQSLATEDPSSLSKRNLLSLVSSVFDPLGLISPLTIKGKILIREAWQLKVGWDEPLPSSFYAEWLKLKPDLMELKTISFPRKVWQEDEECQLHVFSDASAKAYGAVAFLVANGESNILTSKARVTPMKSRSLPQLELTAIQIATQLANYITSILKDINKKEVYIWSDSEVALQWIKNDNSKMPYVKNRVQDINNKASTFKFLYVPTNSNPADLLSRGVSLAVIRKDNLWMHGPSWLCQPDNWPEQKHNVVSMNIVTETDIRSPIFIASNISSLTKILTITDNVFKFLKRIKPSFKQPKATSYWLHQVQQEQYKEEYEYLNTLSSNKVRPDLVKSLGLYVDPETQIIHCTGRLSNSDLSTSAKFPALLPRKSWLTTLLVERAHKQTLHGGVSETLSLIREQYWIPKGRQVVKVIIKNCVVCKRIEGRVMKLPGPPALPKERVIHTEPFHTVGVDYTGAIMIKNATDDSLKKYYVCLFTCATSRAVHLELAKDLSAQTFVNLLRRFVARRSSPKLIISDNASNFKGTDRFLKDLYNDPLVKMHLNNYQIEWKFLPPRSPWMGGFYERLIGLVKNCLRKVLLKRKISEDELQTLLTEIEMRVNNRPLTYIDDDINHPQPLTPSHLIHGRRLQPMPTELEDRTEDPDYNGIDEVRKRYSFLCNRIKHWEKVWKNEYLTSLRERFYGAQTPNQNEDLKVGDIVIIEDEGRRETWPLGKITAMHPDDLGIIRVVEVYCKGTLSLKTLNKLIPLELHCDPKENEVQVLENKKTRDGRKAAIKAQKAIHDLYHDDLA